MVWADALASKTTPSPSASCLYDTKIAIKSQQPTRHFRVDALVTSDGG